MGSPLQRIVWPDAAVAADPGVVGPKAAALARVARLGADGGAAPAVGVPVPPGFVVSTAAWREVLGTDGLRAQLRDSLAAVSHAEGTGRSEVHTSAVAARELLLGAPLPDALRAELRRAHDRLVADRGTPGASGPVLLAVRSSATAEDLPGASFAGQYDSHLGVHGPEQLFDAYRAVLSSAYSDRAIAYRRARGIGPLEVEMAVLVQVLVRADLGGAAGVLFSRDPEDPGADRTLVEAVPGLGAALVGGTADPDRYLVLGTVGEGAVGPAGDAGTVGHVEVRRPEGSARSVLTDAQVRRLADWGRRLEAEWGGAVDVEWAVDGPSGELVLVQCRPLGLAHVPPSEQGTGARDGTAHDDDVTDDDAAGPTPPVLARGLAVGTGRAGGTARRIDDPFQSAEFHEGDVLVTHSTDPSWLGLMQRAGGLVTDHGGRTSHAAIVSRELGLLAVVGCGDATRAVADGTNVRIACTSNGLGVVYGADASG